MNGRKQGNARNLRGISPGQPAIDLPGSRVALGRRPGNVLCVEYLHIIAAVTAALTLFLGSLYCWSLCMFDYCCRGQCRPIRCSPQAHKRWATPGGTGGPWGSPSPPPPHTRLEGSGQVRHTVNAASYTYAQVINTHQFDAHSCSYVFFAPAAALPSRCRVLWRFMTCLTRSPCFPAASFNAIAFTSA